MLGGIVLVYLGQMFLLSLSDQMVTLLFLGLVQRYSGLEILSDNILFSVSTPVSKLQLFSLFFPFSTPEPK